jgi:hypothetical protein
MPYITFAGKKQPEAIRFNDLGTFNCKATMNAGTASCFGQHSIILIILIAQFYY